MNNNSDKNYIKYYKQKITQKEPTLHTLSVDLKNIQNTLYTKYHKNNQPELINFSNNIKKINPKNNSKLFKNIKLYEVSKQANFVNKRNSKSQLKNGVPYVSFTEINNLKKIFSTHFKINNNNLTNYNNNTITLYHKNYYNSNNNINKNIIKINKSLPKSKSNNIFFIPSNFYDIRSRNKNINNALIKSNSLSRYNKTSNNSNNKKLVNSKINKCNIHFSPLNVNHTISLSSQKNNKLNENRKGGSNIGSSEDKIKIQKLMKEKERQEEDIKCKDKIIKEQENIIILLKENEIALKEKVQIINNKYEELKNNYEIIINENNILKNKLSADDKNIINLKEKEQKLMKMLYLIKEKGIDINEILSEVKNESNKESKNKSESSERNIINNLTIYFPDKIKMKNIMDTKEAQNLPKINFNQIPEYSFQSEEQKNSNKGEEMFEQDELNYNGIGLKKYGLEEFHRNSA